MVRRVLRTDPLSPHPAGPVIPRHLLSRDPERPLHTDDPREQLRALIRRQGAIASTAERPLLSRNGRTLPWQFYGWGFSLTHEGATLAAHCLLEKLSLFKSTQIASHGYTALPFVSACVALGRGRYRGLAVRDRAKPHGHRGLIEGGGDRAQPVVIVDDCLSTGTSFFKAVKALEDGGFSVEGLVCVVEFPGQGGREWAESVGFRVEAVFPHPGREDVLPYPTFTPGHLAIVPEWRDARIPDGLHPAHAARAAAEAYVEDGTVPLPPARLDGAHAAPGGVFVSIRDRWTGARLARGGFWHFDATQADLRRDVVLATVRALRSAARPLTPERLADAKVAVALLGPLETVMPGGLDFFRHGMVIRCDAQPWKMGGALPNTEYFTSEMEQYRHALKNARVPWYVPHRIQRHTVTRLVEPGESWSPAGATAPDAAWTRGPALGDALLRRARQVLRAAMAGDPSPAEGALDDALAPVPLAAVSVTLYRDGLLGCRVSFGGSLDECVARATQGAWDDPRRARGGPVRDAGEVRIAVTLMHDARALGRVSLARAAETLRVGLEGVSVAGDRKGGVMLAQVATHYSWTGERLCRALLAKSGVPEERANWTTLASATWIEDDGRGAVPLEFGFPARDGRAPVADEDGEALGGYVLRQIGADGLPAYAYDPVRGARTTQGGAGRRIFALGALHAAGRALGRADFTDAARRGLTHCASHLQAAEDGPALRLPGERAGFAADVVLLWALADAGELALAGDAADALAARVAARLHPDGVFADARPGRRLGIDHDILPGAGLLALARYEAAGGRRVLPDDLGPSLRFYRGRFRAGRPWAMVHWQLQAWSALHAASGDPEQAAFVFELADWAAANQLEKNGAFVSTLYPRGPSFHTACVLEGMADALATARRVDDGARAEAYARSVDAGLAFMDRLVIRPRDTFCMPDPAAALGGVRESPVSSLVRIDYVAHHLLVLARLASGGPALPARAALHLPTLQLQEAS